MLASLPIALGFCVKEPSFLGCTGSDGAIDRVNSLSKLLSSRYGLYVSYCSPSLLPFSMVMMLRA